MNKEDCQRAIQDVLELQEVFRHETHYDTLWCDTALSLLRAELARPDLRQSQVIVDVNEGEWPVRELMQLIDEAMKETP